jgi:hypothetical protein
VTVIARSIAAVLLVAWLIAGCGAAGPAPSGPAPSPRITCVGVPPEKCAEAVASVARSLPNETPVAIDVTCVAGECTSASGAMDTAVTLAGGGQLHANPLTWGGDGPGSGISKPPQAAPPIGGPLPVEPECQGIPTAMCRQMASNGLSSDASHGAVVKIVVRCTKVPCTDTSGEGDTVMTFADGTTQNSGWGYQGGS